MRCISDELIQKYIDKEASENENSIVQNHLTTCSRCANKVVKYSPHKTERYDVKMEQPLNQFAIEILKPFNNDTSSMKKSYSPYMRQITEMG